MFTKCQHCRGNPAFGRYKLTTDKWTPSGRETVYLDRDLCAECGFNITRFSVMKIAKMKQEIDKPDGTTKTVIHEAFYRKFPYTDCVLMEIYGDSVALIREYDAREKAQRAAEIKANMDRADAKREGRAARRFQREVTVIPIGNITPRKALVSAPSPTVQVTPPSPRYTGYPAAGAHYPAPVVSPRR